MNKAFAIAMVILLILGALVVLSIVLVKYYEKVGGPLIDIFGIIVVRDRFPGDTCDADGNCVDGCCSGGICSTPRVNGSACSENCDCMKGSGCISKICTALIADGIPCPSQDNDTCENTFCERTIPDPATGDIVYVCCPSGDDAYFARDLHNYCTDQPSGAGCYFNTPCASGTCVGADWPNTAGTCS